MAVRRVELVGTENLTSANKLLVYNTNTFKNKDLVERLGLPEIEESSVSSIDNILEKLLGTGLFSYIEKEREEEPTFVYRNQKNHLLGGQGFDTILFLRDDKLLGYTYLGREYGNTFSNKNIVYQVNEITISISGAEDYSLKEGDASLNMEISGVSPRVDNIEKEKKEYRGHGNYGVYLRNFVKGNKQDIFTDSTYIKYNKYAGRLFFKSITLPTNSFTNFQVGYFKGDPVVYAWDDLGNYSIYSLTKEISFGGGVTIPYPYTSPRFDKDKKAISYNEVYTLPDLDLGEQKILYFAGQYCVVEVDEEQYLLDVSSQDSPRDNGPRNKGWVLRGKEIIEGSYLYYRLDDSSNEYVLTDSPDPEAVEFDSVDIASGESIKVPNWNPLYLNDFIVDISLKSKITSSEVYGWKNYQEALKTIGTLCNTYYDSKSLVESGCKVLKKCGDWFIFDIPQDNTYLYTNMTQSVKVSKEDNPIIINDEALLLCDADGSYILFDAPGNYISRNCRLIDGDTSSKICKIESPIDLQKSFFGAFRRGLIPTDVSDFKIIGALSGIIFYKTGNKINYL